jgi:hypothetical protein
MNAGGIFLMPDKAPLDIEDARLQRTIMELLVLLIMLHYVPCENQEFGTVETWTTVHGNTSTMTSTSTGT